MKREKKSKDDKHEQVAYNRVEGSGWFHFDAVSMKLKTAKVDTKKVKDKGGFNSIQFQFQFSSIINGRVYPKWINQKAFLVNGTNYRGKEIWQKLV